MNNKLDCSLLKLLPIISHNYVAVLTSNNTSIATGTCLEEIVFKQNGIHGITLTLQMEFYLRLPITPRADLRKIMVNVGCKTR